MNANYENMKQTTSLHSRIFESSLEWNIENFLECKVEKLTSEVVEIEGTEAAWTLTVYPKRYLDFHGPAHVWLNLQVTDGDPSPLHLFKIDASVDMSGHQLMSPVNRHNVRSEGMYAAPVELEAPKWNVPFSKLPEDEDAVFENQFIHYDEVRKFLSYGSLPLIINVEMKRANIVNTLK